MQNVLGEVSELDQANAQPTTLRLLIAQRLLELFGRDKPSSYQEITQSRQLGSRMRICRYVECSHTNTVAVSADCEEKVNGSKGFRGNLKSDDSSVPSPPAFPQRPPAVSFLSSTRKAPPCTCTPRASDK